MVVVVDEDPAPVVVDELAGPVLEVVGDVVPVGGRVVEVVVEVGGGAEVVVTGAAGGTVAWVAAVLSGG